MLGLRARHRDRGVHGHRHVDRQRLTAILMIATGLLRVAIWLAITVAFVAGDRAVGHWFGSVKFVSLLSILALVLTDWGQVAASLAQLTAGDAHHDAEATRLAIGVDFAQLDADISRLAALQPGPEAAVLASEIRRRLSGGSESSQTDAG